MQFLDLTLPLPAENLALDEALLEACEASEFPDGVLRVWEPSESFVVLGRSSDPTVEVNLAACRQASVPILRRPSGGGTILAGPGCLMYSVVSEYVHDFTFTSVSRTHQFVLNRIAASLARYIPDVTIEGYSDLAFRAENNTLQKFSGNAVRMKRTAFLYHGTLMYDFPVDRVSELLAQQTREPKYRDKRPHGAFIANLPLPRDAIVAALAEAWQANEPQQAWPQDRMQRIVKEKYVSDSRWTIEL